MKAFIASAIIAVSCFAAAPAAKQPAKPASGTAATSAGKRPVVRTPYRTWAANRYSRYRAPVRRWAPRRPVYVYQMQPTVDRYKEIQTALAAKGYYSGEVSGTWGIDSVEAMKRFQVDQNIPPGDGRMNSLSLIALGLGPKRENPHVVPNPTKDAVTAPAPPVDNRPAVAEN